MSPKKEREKSTEKKKKKKKDLNEMIRTVYLLYHLHPILSHLPEELPGLLSK